MMCVVLAGVKRHATALNVTSFAAQALS